MSGINNFFSVCFLLVLFLIKNHPGKPKRPIKPNNPINPVSAVNVQNSLAPLEKGIVQKGVVEISGGRYFSYKNRKEPHPPPNNRDLVPSFSVICVTTSKLASFVNPGSIGIVTQRNRQFSPPMQNRASKIRKKKIILVVFFKSELVFLVFG